MEVLANPQFRVLRSSWSTKRRLDISAAVLCLYALLCAQVRPQPSQLEPPFTLTIVSVTDTADSDLRPFLQNMYVSVKKKAMDTLPKSVLHGERGVVTIQLQIQKNGKLLYLPKVLESSGSKTLEHHAVGAIRGAVPFDKLPASSPALVELRLKFFYNMASSAPND